MTASWEVAASRFTKIECDAFAATHSLLAAGVTTGNILANTRFRGYIDQVWFNEGEYDPNLADGTELDFDGQVGGFNYIKGGLYLAGDNAKPWEVWEWAENQYNLGPDAFLAQTFSTSRVAQLTADLSPETAASTEPNKFLAAANAIIQDPAGNGMERITFPYGKMAPGNNASAQVDVGATTSSTCPILLHRPGNEGLFKVGSGIQLQAQLASETMQITAGATAATDIIFVAEGANRIADGNGQILITGCNKQVFNRTFYGVTPANDGSFVLDYTAGGTEASEITSGSAIICGNMHTATITNVVDNGGGKLDITFDPPMPSGLPYETQYVCVQARSSGDRTIQALIDDIVAMPAGSRTFQFNAPLSINNDANVKMRFHDGASGGSVIPMDRQLQYCGEMIRLYCIEVKAGLDAAGVTLDFCYMDWEGAGQWYSMNWEGSQNQLIDEHNAASSGDSEYTRWGFPVADCVSVGNQTTQTPEAPITNNEMRYFSITSWNITKSLEYLEVVAASVKDIFGDQVNLQGFRSGTLQGWQTRPDRGSTVQSNPISAQPMPNIRPDSLAVWRRFVGTDNTNVDMTADPPVRVLHPLASGTGSEVRYASVETAWQFFQIGNRMWGRPTIPTTYGYQDTQYHPGMASSPEWMDQVAHLFCNSDQNFLMLFNKRSTDDKPIDDLLLELEHVFPTGTRVPRVLEDIGGEQWGHGYVRSACDNNGEMVWYYTLNPSAGGTIVQDGTDVVVTFTDPQYALESHTIGNGTIIVPPNRQTPGVWIRQQAGGSIAPSWCEYIRGEVAAAIEKDRADGLYAFNDFTVKETYYPAAAIEDIAAEPVCYVIGLAADDETVSRDVSYATTQPIQVAFQAVLESVSDTVAIDIYVKMIEQIKQTIANAGINRAQWMNHAALRDPSNNVINFVGLREQHTFESYFSSQFRYVAQNGEDPPT